MFEVVIHYWMTDTCRVLTDAAGIAATLAALNMVAVSAIEIQALKGD